MNRSPSFRQSTLQPATGSLPPAFSTFPGRNTFPTAIDMEDSCLDSPDNNLVNHVSAAQKTALQDAILKTADSYFSRNHLVIARDFLMLLDQFDGHTAQTWQTLGNLHYLLADFLPACAAFERALEQSPDNAGLWVFLAATNRCLNDTPYFERCLSRALSLQPDNLDALKLRADSYRDQGRFEDAAEIYTNLLGQYPDQVEILMPLAKCHFRLGNPKKTHALLAQTLAIDPANESALENLAMLKTLEPDSSPAK